MIQAHHASVIRRPFIGTHPKQGAHRSGHLHEEATGRAGLTRPTPTLGATFGAVPAARCLVDPLSREDTNAPQPHVAFDGKVGVFPRVFKVFFQAIVLRTVGQDVVAPQVTGEQPIFPRHPLGGEECPFTRHHVDLAHRGGTSAGNPRQGHCPAPANVSGINGSEVVGSQAFAFHLEPDVFADGARVGDGFGAFARNVNGGRKGGIHTRPRRGQFFRHQNPQRQLSGASQFSERSRGNDRDAGKRMRRPEP